MARRDGGDAGGDGGDVGTGKARSDFLGIRRRKSVAGGGETGCFSDAPKDVPRAINKKVERHKKIPESSSSM